MDMDNDLGSLCNTKDDPFVDLFVAQLKIKRQTNAKREQWAAKQTPMIESLDPRDAEDHEYDPVILSIDKYRQKRPQVPANGRRNDSKPTG